MRNHHFPLPLVTATTRCGNRAFPALAAIAAFAVFATVVISGTVHAQSFDARQYRWPDGVAAIHNKHAGFFREGNIEARTRKLAYGLGFISVLGLQCNLFRESEKNTMYGIAGAIYNVFEGDSDNPGTKGEKDAQRFLPSYGCNSQKVRDSFSFLKAATNLGPENPDAPF